MIISYCPPPDTHSRVILKSQDEDDFLTTYINANYLKVSENMCIYKQNLAPAQLCDVTTVTSTSYSQCQDRACVWTFIAHVVGT